jgi:transcriptional regulator with XRE-family HTH domain
MQQPLILTAGTVATDLRSMRHGAGLSQLQLAQRAGCSLAAVALFESGYRPAKSAVLPRILEVLQNERDRRAGNATVSANRAGGPDVTGG